MRNQHLYGLACVLAAIGFGVFAYKVYQLDFPVIPGATYDIWDIEYRMRFQAGGDPVKLVAHLPQTDSRFFVGDEHFVSRQFGLSVSDRQGARHAIWSVREARGEQVLYYRATVQRAAKERSAAVRPDATPQIDVPELDEGRLAAAQSVLKESLARSADNLTLAAEVLRRLNHPRADPNAAAVAGSRGISDVISAAVIILNLGLVPARPVLGVMLHEHRENLRPTPWLEVYDGSRWQYIDPRTGDVSVPDKLLILARDASRIAQITGAHNLTVGVSVRRQPEAAVMSIVSRSDLLKNPVIRFFSLSTLPVATQEVYRVLLLIPIGAFVLVLLRNVIGIRTFGTFMPVLIALAFRETHLLAGIAMFTLIVALGLAVRFYLEQLKLLVVPRLAAVLIVVVMLMGWFSIFANLLGFESGLSVALFPMVIMSMTIERMSVVWDERGASHAIRQGASSLAAAAIAFLVMEHPLVQHFSFVFPELMFVVLALTLLLGRYSGYRLTELGRFRVLAE